MAFKITENEEGVFVSFDEDNKAYMFDIYPLDLKRSEPPERLTILTSECLRNQLEARESSVNPRSLIGECHKNARNLFQYLCGHGYDPNLIVGCNLSAGRAVGVKESFKNIKNIHQWVEVGSYTAEICSEADGSMGKLYVSKNRPSNYQAYITLSEGQVRSLPVQYVTADNIDKVVESIDED